MPGEPSVRARHLKSLLAFADAWPGGIGPAVRARVRPADLQAVAAASGIDWIPLRIDLDLTRGIHDAMPRPEFLRFFRKQSLQAFEGPLLKTLVDTAQRMFGIEAASWARWVPKGWSLLFRDCGVWTSEVTGPKRIDLRLASLPTACASDPIWIASVGASLSALVDLAKLDGAVEPVATEPTAVRFEMTWR